MSSNSNYTKLFAGSGAVTLFNALRAFAINKLLAIFLPPAAFACVGQFLNFMSIGSATSSLALQNGWTALTAQNKENRDKLLGIWRGGLRLTTFASLLTFVFALLFCFMAPLETLLPGVPTRLAQAAILFALPGVFATNIITISAAVMNGLGENRKWALINIVTSMWQVLWVAFFLYTGRLSVLSIIATQSIVAAIFASQIAGRAGFSVKRCGGYLAECVESFGFSVHGDVCDSHGNHFAACFGQDEPRGIFQNVPSAPAPHYGNFTCDGCGTVLWPKHSGAGAFLAGVHGGGRLLAAPAGGRFL